MIKKYTFGGSLYEHKERWYWKVTLPNEKKRRTIALHRHGEVATRNESLAKELAQRMWDESIKKASGVIPAIRTVGELKSAYSEWAVTHYPAGSAMLFEVKLALGLLDCDDLPVDDFGPARFRQARDKMIGREKELSVKTVNERGGIIRRMFEWGVGREVVRPEVSYALKMVETVTGKTVGVKPSKTRDVVPIESVTATLPYLSEVLQSAVKVQLYAGMRPSETLLMRPCDLDMSDDIWMYKPADHKNAWRGEEYNRIIGICKKAQQVLIPLIAGRRQDDYIFKPAEAVTEFRQKRAADRKTPLSYGNRSGTNNKGTFKTGEHYTKDGYRIAIKRAVMRLNNDREAAKQKPIKMWTPYQIRHTTATILRAASGDKGLSIVQAFLGQKSFDVAQIYAKVDKSLIAEAIQIIDGLNV